MKYLWKRNRPLDKDGLLRLIAQMNTRDEKYTCSSETTSWKAHRKAETMDDPNLFPLLREIIRENEGKGKAQREVRSAAYFIYGRLLEKVFQKEDCDFFVRRLEVETNKYILSSMLDRVHDWRISKGIVLTPGLDISPIIDLTRDERWLVRHSAIYALIACPGEESRQALAFYLQQEDEKAYKYEIYYANIAMQAIGKSEDILLLERFLKSRSPTLKNTAEYAIQCIREREATLQESCPPQLWFGK